ncbi:GGDEF domain-containing protein [Pikeienuella piscinae]|uniref:GGDEF domain-containing protein n=1 Tax=Pikeienuella piscinae TaxID=2748098 RepID=A0A7L5BXH2_9RHOB|nr:bifunctional diguanylate cyclase/phosphodiesterase [Pikeienuella piscinae]QIE55843.1 GGDEF domain-containing protein [Pikeienuella piscinae]
MGRVLAMDAGGERKRERAIESAGGAPSAIMERDALTRRLSWVKAPSALLVASMGALSAVNRIYGHASGDRLVEGAAARVLSVAPEGALVARLSGAKIVVLAPAQTPEAAQALARALADAMAAAPDGPAVDPRLGAAWTPALAPGAGETLIAAALGALDRAASGGREIELALFDPAAERDELGRARRALDLIRAGCASIALQPVVNADASGRLMFREALIRVTGLDGAAIPADRFMPQLERLGMTEEADVAALRLAFDELAKDPGLRISVNLSGAAITRRRWPDAFARLAAAQPNCAARLIVEVTEEAAIARAGAAIGLFSLIRAHGAALALDDFGAGRTSFRHLRDFRFDMVKIDGGFIRGIDASADNQMLVSALVGIARQFDMMVIAEFVETAAEARALRALGVDGFQGFFFGRPALVWSDEDHAGRGVAG